jgi:hypothetical protein
MNSKGYFLLIEKLDAFIRKYYKNQLIRGAIYFAAATLLFFLLVIALEYFGRYQSGVRAGLFYSFLAFTVFCLTRFVLIPLSKLYKLGKGLNHEEASVIIGNHFPQVKDKLLNVLQLKKEVSSGDHSLIEAAINQKTLELTPVPFTAAIDLNKNVRYLRYIVLPVVLYALIYLIAPSMIKDSSRRVLLYNQTFKPVAPFSFEIENDALSAQQFSDFNLNLKVDGSEIPQDVFVMIGEHRYKMQKQDNLHFTYTFTNIQKDIPFQLEANGFYSDDYLLKALAKPLILNYRAKLVFPGYLGKKTEWIDNPTDLTIPAGTTVKWEFNTVHTDDIRIGFNHQYIKAQSDDQTHFSYEKKFFIGGPFTILTGNSGQHISDSMSYQLNVLPDAFPGISVDEKPDSLSGKQLFFIGDATDDHGLTRLAFQYQLKREGTIQPEPKKMQWLPFEQGGTSARFYHQLNLNEIGVQPGDELTYYFEVWDNDGVHGSKSTKSAIKQLRAPSEKELEEKTEAGSSALKEKMEQAMKEAKQLQKEMKELDRKMLEKRELTWEEKKKMEQLLEQQKELVKKIESIKKENEKLNREEAEYRKQEDQILEKQQQLEKMFNELMDEEMKKLIKEMEQMVQMQNKDLMKQEMEKMQLNNKDVEKELDRMLEQYKKLELEKKLENTTQKLDELAQKQEDLAQKTKEANDKGKTSEQKKAAQEELKKQQEKLSEEFKERQDELKEIEKQNKELEEPGEMENTDEEQQEIEQQQEGSEQDLDKGDNKKAGEKQNKAAQAMKKMSQKMKDKKAEQEQKELELDVQALREILENTIQLSKDQEALMDQMQSINGYNPQFVEAARTQKKVKADAKIIEDSLLALSKRVTEISAYVNREVSKLNDNLDRSVQSYGDRNFPDIRVRQQYSMTHANNLALMLSDILKQMQNDMDGSGESKGQGKPKKGKGKGGKGSSSGPKSMSELKKAQEELNKQLREGMNKQGKGDKENGQKPGEKPGDKPGGGSQGMGGMSSRDYARMAAQQQAIRQQMQKMLNQMGSKEKEGLGGQQKLQEMQKLMEQTEKELYNKQLSNQLIQRQQDIMTRLLESEKAERKQEQDNKREAEQAKEKPTPTPPDFEQYIRQKNKEKELLETIPAEMQPYYKEKAKEYFNKIGTQ